MVSQTLAKCDWDNPEPALVALLQSHALPQGKGLEVGLGTGRNAPLLLYHCSEMVAFDSNPEQRIVWEDTCRRNTLLHNVNVMWSDVLGYDFGGPA